MLPLRARSGSRLPGPTYARCNPREPRHIVVERGGNLEHPAGAAAASCASPWRGARFTCAESPRAIPPTTRRRSTVLDIESRIDDYRTRRQRRSLKRQVRRLVALTALVVISRARLPLSQDRQPGARFQRAARSGEQWPRISRAHSADGDWGQRCSASQSAKGRHRVPVPHRWQSLGRAAPTARLPVQHPRRMRPRARRSSSISSSTLLARRAAARSASVTIGARARPAGRSPLRHGDADTLD